MPKRTSSRQKTALRRITKKIRPLNANIGDPVYALKEVRGGKIDSHDTGPHTIAGVTEKNNVILETEDGERLPKKR